MATDERGPRTFSRGSALAAVLAAHDASSRVTVVLAPGVLLAPSEVSGAGVTVRRLTQRPAPVRQDEAFVLVAHDAVDLRRAATGMGNVGSCSVVSIVFERGPAYLPATLWDPGWPALESAHVESSPQAAVRLRFVSPVAVRRVVVHLAHACTPSRTAISSWPVLGVRRGEPMHWAPADPATVVAGPRRLLDPDSDVPPDVVLAEQADGLAEHADDPHPVTGRAPVVVHAGPDLTWAELDAAPGEARDRLRRAGALSLGPVDDRLFNPVHFDRSPHGVAVAIRSRPDGALVVPGSHGEDLVVADVAGRVSDADLPLLRRLPGLRLDWAGTAGPQAYCRAVAALACAGVPLTGAEPPPWAASLLAPSLLAALSGTDEFSDPLEREERSIRVRRAALAHHGAAPWRRALAASVGVPQGSGELVSVLLTTRRPEMLSFALGQVARQRVVAFELVLATHGFTPDDAPLAEFAERCTAPVTVVEAAADLAFGEALNLAASRARGEVLVKMDDDDWYGPDFLHDLLLARSYSGAGLVGCLPEITFLAPRWTTTRRDGATEVFHPVVAGGTMMLDAGVLRSVGGFRRTRKYVDAQLLHVLSGAGVGIYRTHGLGYVLHRRSHGHTWDPGLDYFLEPARAAHQWPGFRPSTLLECRPEDVPRRT